MFLFLWIEWKTIFLSLFAWGGAGGTYSLPEVAWVFPTISSSQPVQLGSILHSWNNSVCTKLACRHLSVPVLFQALKKKKKFLRFPLSHLHLVLKPNLKHLWMSGGSRFVSANILYKVDIMFTSRCFHHHTVVYFWSLSSILCKYSMYPTCMRSGNAPHSQNLVSTPYVV